jgi:hypothetical protein
VSSYQSYSTYVASTIHVRIAAQRGPTSEASRLLGVCLEALQENGATNPGVQKMLGMIQALMGRMGVALGETGENQPHSTSWRMCLGSQLIKQMIPLVSVSIWMRSSGKSRSATGRDTADRADHSTRTAARTCSSCRGTRAMRPIRTGTGTGNYCSIIRSIVYMVS